MSKDYFIKVLES